MDIRVAYDPYLVSVVAEAATAAGRLLDLDADLRRKLGSRARRLAGRMSARLDGSPLDDSTADAVESGRWRRPGDINGQDTAHGWAAALRLEGMATPDVAAVEYDNLLTAYDREPDWAGRLFDEPLRVLTEIHGAVSADLVDPDVAGRPRRTEQAVHDGAQGMVIYNAPAPGSLPALLTGLERWLRSGRGGATHPAPVVAAVVHELVLQWQPFESSNGRVARTGCRVVLRARGLDPHGLAVPEQRWAADPAGYHREVAATIRRRGDLGPWTERHTETLLEALDAVAAVAGLPPRGGRPGERARRTVAQMSVGETVTVADHAARWGISAEAAERDLRTLTVNKLLVREPRTLGRRYRRV